MGVELLGTARDAFSQAFTLTAGICAGIALIMAVPAVLFLNVRRPAPSRPR